MTLGMLFKWTSIDHIEYILHLNKMIDFVVTVFSTLNFLQLDYCAVKWNVSYIYVDSNEILFGVMGNSLMTHYNMSMNETCKHNPPPFAHLKKAIVDITTTEPNSVVTRLPISTVTALPIDGKNVTEEAMEGDCKCSQQDCYYLLLVSVVTFGIGLVMKPDRLYDKMRIRLSSPVYEGNDLSRIRNKL